MPFATIDNTRLFYRLEGNDGQPVLVLSHSIGTDHGMWTPQVPDLLPYVQILRYDTRGHGASEAPKGDYSIERLGRDVLGLADALGISKFAFCGISLGGAIGQWLAAHAPDRVSGLVLANTSPQFGPPANWETRRRTVLDGGMAANVDMAIQRFFSPQMLARADGYAMSVRSVLLGTDHVRQTISRGCHLPSFVKAQRRCRLSCVVCRCGTPVLGSAVLGSPLSRYEKTSPRQPRKQSIRVPPWSLRAGGS